MEQPHDKVCEIMIWAVSFGEKTKVRQQFSKFKISRLWAKIFQRGGLLI
jgi:hypothetical protein